MTPEMQEQMRRQAGANGAPAAGLPPGQMPAGAAMPGQTPPGGEMPGLDPQFGAGGAGNQSPFGGNVEAGTPEFAVQQFLNRLRSGDVNGAEDLFSRKATGKAKVIRSGKASESIISELKEGVANVTAQPAMNLLGKHVIVLEENASAAPAAPPPQQTSTRSRSRRQTDRGGKATRKVQFTVVEEEGQMVIQDIKIHVTVASIRNR
jgi:hypothetical protein